MKFFLSLLTSCLLLLGSTLSQAEQFKQFGPYKIHYSVVNTTFLDPKVAAAYGITRGKKKAILNIAIREQLDDGSDRAKAAIVNGRSWDLISEQANYL